MQNLAYLDGVDGQLLECTPKESCWHEKEKVFKTVSWEAGGTWALQEVATLGDVQESVRN